MQGNLYFLIAIALLSRLGQAGKIDWQQVTPKPTNFNFVASFTFNGTEIFTTGHSAYSNSEFTGGILVRNGYNWDYTACYPYDVVTIESITYVPHLNKLLGVGGSTAVTFDPKNISNGCTATTINGAYRLYGIAAGNGVILAANSDSSILFSSTNGQSWGQVNKLPFQNYHGLLFDSTYNRFMLTSVNGTFASVNGKDWWRLQSNNDSLAFQTMKIYANKLVGIAYSDTRYVRRIYISDNSNSSLHWREITPFNPGSNVLFFTFPLTSEAGSSIFVSLQGNQDFHGSFNTSIWRTDDFGNTWQLVWNKNNSFVPNTILRSGNEWLIGGQNGKLISTSDWTTFTPVFPSYSLSSDTFFHVSFVNGQFILSGSNSVYRSIDGYSWDKISDDGFYSITYSPISKLYIGIPNVGIWTSPDLKNWTRATVEKDIPRKLYFSRTPIQTKEGYLVVSGQIGDVFYPTGLWVSVDGGLNWSKNQQQFGISTCGQFLATLGYANNTVYVSCPSGYPITMSNTNVTSKSNTWRVENYNYYKFLTGGQGSVQDTLIALTDSYSTGHFYQMRNHQWLTTFKFYDYYSESTDPLPRRQLYLNGKFWTLFRSGQAFTSTDGFAWTTETVNMYGIRHMAYEETYAGSISTAVVIDVEAALIAWQKEEPTPSSPNPPSSRPSSPTSPLLLIECQSGAVNLDDSPVVG